MRKSANTCTRDLRCEFQIEEFCGKRRIDLSLFLFSKEISEISKVLLPESKDDAFLNVIGALGSLQSFVVLQNIVTISVLLHRCLLLLLLLQMPLVCFSMTTTMIRCTDLESRIRTESHES